VTGLLAVLAGCGGSAAPPASAEQVRPGIDVLLEDSVHLVRGRRVGLVTNQAGVDAHGVSDVDRLLEAGVDLVALFSPEHGFRGTADPGAAVANTRDSATGLPIYSLYGQTASPTDAMLSGIDVMLVDLQDAGARYYTYITTTASVMSAAGARGIPVVVLDRPDPIGGTRQGNVLDTAFRSAVGFLRVPMRHGLTLGELSRLARRERRIDVTLTVVPVGGWRRSMAFDQTGLPFVRPSPNLPTLESLFHYPGLCLFEGTALSVGRGSSAPFEQIGAPWLDAAAVLAAMRAAGLPGVAFDSVRFTPVAPGDGKFGDSASVGVRLRVTDRARYDPTVTAVYLLATVLRRHPDRFGWRPAAFDRLAGGPALRRALEAGEDPAAVVAGWGAAVEAFDARVRDLLLY